MARDTNAGTPWWLRGEETCAFCWHRYIYEAEYRCQACDAPVCPDCVVTVRETDEIVCPECAADAEWE